MSGQDSDKEAIVATGNLTPASHEIDPVTMAQIIALVTNSKITKSTAVDDDTTDNTDMTKVVTTAAEVEAMVKTSFGDGKPPKPSELMKRLTMGATLSSSVSTVNDTNAGCKEYSKSSDRHLCHTGDSLAPKISDTSGVVTFPVSLDVSNGKVVYMDTDSNIHSTPLGNGMKFILRKTHQRPSFCTKEVHSNMVGSNMQGTHFVGVDTF